ncbi:hypothetical protein OG563_37120 [Nocardia vinacea]|uniref:Uncharacterized protein n=1 Tax=Nocardia vinacea TaxID=96468 RepID=A0ABZ1YR38_9NOCA|nr:hypothetical protein [Nocardia vinacea]
MHDQHGARRPDVLRDSGCQQGRQKEIRLEPRDPSAQQIAIQRELDTDPVPALPQR